MNRINQDTEIARQISLWDQRGSQVIRGELLVIPIEEPSSTSSPSTCAPRGAGFPSSSG
jgi:uncharacterized protein